MPPKVIPTTATISRLVDVQDTSMEDARISNNSDGAWFQDILQQLTVNQNALKVKLDVYNHQPVKMPSIEIFAGDKVKLKGFIM